MQLFRGRKKQPSHFSFTLTSNERSFLGGYQPIDFRKLYQQARVEFDRGRVTVAISIINTGKPNRLQEPLLTAAASGLESVLVHHAEIPAAREQWDQIDAQISDYIRRRKRRNRIALIILLVILISPCLIAIIAAWLSK